MRSQRQLTESEILKSLEEDIPSDISFDSADSDDTNDNSYSLEPTTSKTILSDSDTSSDSEDECPATISVIRSPETELSQTVTVHQTPSEIADHQSKTDHKWSKTERPDDAPTFFSQCGPSVFIVELGTPSPYQLFGVLLSDDIMDLFLFQVNLYAQQSSLTTGKPYVPASMEELKTFLGINILMGIKPLPSYRDYWSSGADLHDSYVSQLMSRRRFRWFLTNLHLNDNSKMAQCGDTNYDKLYKLRPFLERISHNFQKALNPNECMAVDESMIKFKGRSTIKQYLPKKPIKRGYKVWVLADKSGYAWKVDIYTGKKDNAVEKKFGERVVKDLTENIKGKDHRVYFDNYFSSPDLRDLKENKINACGTVNPNRKSLPMLKSEKEMKRGDYDWATSNTGLSVMKWKDKRSVHLLSNFHDPTQKTEVTRKEKDGNEIKVSCPIALSVYNANMNCVDKFDQLKGVYETDRKSRIFWYFIDATVVNAFITHKEMKLPKMTLKDFRREIARDLLAPVLVASRGKKRSLSSHLQFNKKKPNVPKSVRLESSSARKIYKEEMCSM
ncbi:piggyBac transposable element-derived protein 4-like [Schistocerca piceifrons]|uniref:piggyBac transposable element-derived protein 4-like n=1 Tax=Schistocerca piceifrons TaxID=274613 RepID=UPI001F5EE9F1|nr:piggyBac transposable element-derived protein 4-like [Schistocerca piceifrons]